MATITLKLDVTKEQAKLYRYATKRMRAHEEDEKEARAILAEIIGSCIECLEYMRETAGANIK